MVKKPITIDHLARMVNKGFEKIDEKLDKRFDGLESRIDNLENGHDEIKLRLDNVAYRFEVGQLKERVKKLEMKVGLRKA